MNFQLKAISIGIVCLLVLSVFIFSPAGNNDRVSAKTLYVGGNGGNNYTKIQAALDAANPGDSVYVYAGTYKENVFINKTINLVGESRVNTTIYGRANGHVITVNANWVNISGFRIVNSGSAHLNAGIGMVSVNNCTFSDNNISYNGFNGISILASRDINVINNIMTHNQGGGMFVRYASIRCNIINNTISNNCLNNDPNVAGLSIFYFSNDNFMSGNKITNNNLHGVIMWWSNDNEFKLNTISNNKNGITFSGTDNGNLFYLNDFINNTIQVNGTSSSRFWNSLTKITYIYNNTNFTSYLGNYWDDYTGKDTDGDGIGETPYMVGTDKDNYPLVKSLKYYILIPSSTKVVLTEVNSKTGTEKVSILIHDASANASVTGAISGHINFTDLHFVIINSGSFAGRGFFTSEWTAIVGGLPYNGTWRGMMFLISSEKKFYLKGTLFGELEGKTDGYLAESGVNIGKYDLLNSTALIYKAGVDVVYADLVLNGTVDYHKVSNTTSELYMLQALFKGNATGYYNKPLSVVITHVRIANTTHPYYGYGFSVITYTSAWGTGSGWTMDCISSPKIENLTGFFTKPLWGIVFGKLDESRSKRILTITIIRFDLGAPPSAIVNVMLKGPWRASPGDKFGLYIVYYNIGLKSVSDAELVLHLPKNTTEYNSSTSGGVYNSTRHEVTWNLSIPAKSKAIVYVKGKVKWGLKWGTLLNNSCEIIDKTKKITLDNSDWTIRIAPAKDPNAKHGTEGYVKPGEQITYTIEFENEGPGKAYGVYLTDTLSEHLSEDSLIIGSAFSKKDNSIIGEPGYLDIGTRTITWFVGELGPGEGGYAQFNVNVRSDAKPGSEILNYGIVYFPSVPEITNTNVVVSIVRPNEMPIADAGNVREALTFERLIFDGSGSVDPDGTIVDYAWDFGDGETGDGVIVSHEYTEKGVYEVKLTVTDNYGDKDSHEITVTVLNRAPAAALLADATEIYPDEQVNFYAGESTDRDGTVVEYNFDFGDGTGSGWVTSAAVSHIYSGDLESYTAKLTVRDNDGALSTNLAEAYITVNERIPVARLTAGEKEAYTFEDIDFDGSGSFVSEGTLSGYNFDFGDGTKSGWVDTPKVSHRFTDGTMEYTVKLTVKDVKGAEASAALAVLIKNRKPTATAGQDAVSNTNLPVNFDGSMSTDMDGELLEFNWDFGDGETGAGETLAHAYSDDGEYEVTLTVLDDDGARAQDTCTVTVNNVKPVAGFRIMPSSGDIDTMFYFRSTSLDTDGVITGYLWNFDDGSTSDLAEPKHKFAEAGVYEISLTVTDDDDLSSDAVTIELTVKDTDTSDGLPPDTGDNGRSTDKTIELPYSVLAAVLILVIIMSILMIMFRKRHAGVPMLGEPFAEDKTLKAVSSEVLTDSRRENLSISRDGIWDLLEEGREKGELSDTAYNYIAENVLYPEEAKH